MHHLKVVCSPFQDSPDSDDESKLLLLLFSPHTPAEGSELASGRAGRCSSWLKPTLGDKSNLGKPLHASPKYQFDLPRQLQSQGGFGFRSSTCSGWFWHGFPLGRARGEGRGPKVPCDLLGWRPGRLARVPCDIIVPWELLKTNQAKYKTHRPTLNPLILLLSFLTRNAGSGVRQTVVFRVLGKEVHHNIS